MVGESIRKFLVTASTTAILCYGICDQIPTPSITIQAPQIISQDYAWEQLLRNPYYSMEDQSGITNKVHIIHGFAKTLLDSSRDLDPEIVGLVDKHFWELI
jgi:hypothetical protein